MSKPKFRKGDVFFHPEQKVFVIIDDKEHFPNKGGWLYTLKCFTHKTDIPKPYKRYYEHRIISELQALKKTNTIKVLYDEKKK